MATKKKAASKTKYDRDTYMYWYESMQLQRRFEEKAGQLYGQQKIRGFCHLYIGQEACSSGSVSALEKDDKYITAYRDHWHPLALGTSPNAIMAELFGKATGTTKGKGGSMHIFDKEVNFMGGHGIVGAQIPMGAGIGFAEKYKGTIGIYGGVARNTYLVNNVFTHPKYFKSIEDFTKGITQEKDFPATRVAYKLNLKGAAVNVQTACSSSGVAVHLACQNLLAGDNDMMLVGGGRIQPPVEAGHLHTEGHALSPDGYCRSFDADADGMVRGNGMAFIVLKKLEKAIAELGIEDQVEIDWQPFELNPNRKIEMYKNSLIE